MRERQGQKDTWTERQTNAKTDGLYKETQTGTERQTSVGQRQTADEIGRQRDRQTVTKIQTGRVSMKTYCLVDRNSGTQMQAVTLSETERQRDIQETNHNNSRGA